MGIRNSFSKLKKKVKHLGSKHKPDRPEAGADGESIGPASPSPPPEPYVVEGDGKGNGPNADGQQACSTDQLQSDKPVPVPASGSGSGQGGGGAGVDWREVSQRHSHPQRDVEVVVGGEPSQGRDDADEEGEQFYSCSSTPSTPRDGGSTGT